MTTRDLVLLALRRTRRYQKSGLMSPELRHARAMLATWLHSRDVKSEAKIRAIAETTIAISRR